MVFSSPHLQFFGCVRLAVEDMDEVFSGKFTTNKPSPDNGSFFSGSWALALFSGGSVRSVDETTIVSSNGSSIGKECQLTVTRWEAAVHAILDKDTYGGHKLVVVERDQIVEHQEAHHNAGLDKANAATPSEHKQHDRVEYIDEAVSRYGPPVKLNGLNNSNSKLVKEISFFFFYFFGIYLIDT